MIFVFYLSQYNPGRACRALIKGRKEKCQVIRSQSAIISKSKPWLFPTEELCSFVLLEVVFTPSTSRELWAQETLTESINVEVACYYSYFGENISQKQSWEMNDECVRVCCVIAVFQRRTCMNLMNLRYILNAKRITMLDVVWHRASQCINMSRQHIYFWE